MKRRLYGGFKVIVRKPYNQCNKRGSEKYSIILIVINNGFPRIDYPISQLVSVFIDYLKGWTRRNIRIKLSIRTKVKVIFRLEGPKLKKKS